MYLPFLSLSVPNHKDVLNSRSFECGPIRNLHDLAVGGSYHIDINFHIGPEQLVIPFIQLNIKGNYAIGDGGRDVGYVPAQLGVVYSYNNRNTYMHLVQGIVGDAA